MYSVDCVHRPVTVLSVLKYDSEPALYLCCCRLSKQDVSISLGMWQGWATRVILFIALHLT